MDSILKILESTSTLLVGIITVFGGALINYYIDNRKLKDSNNKLKETIKDSSLELQMELQLFNDIKDIITSLFTHTKVDRFLILSAINGTKDFRFATAIYEQHKTGTIQISIGACNKYVRFEFDDHYRRMLKEIEAAGPITYSIEDMPESDLKSIYKMESVNYSTVAHLRRVKIDNENDRIFYCSFATHDNTPFRAEENLHIRLCINQLKSKLETM